MAKAHAEFFNLHEALLFASLGFLLHAADEIPARCPIYSQYLGATNGLNTSEVVSSVHT